MALRVDDYIKYTQNDVVILMFLLNFLEYIAIEYSKFGKENEPCSLVIPSIIFLRDAIKDTSFGTDDFFLISQLINLRNMIVVEFDARMKLYIKNEFYQKAVVFDPVIKDLFIKEYAFKDLKRTYEELINIHNIKYLGRKRDYSTFLKQIKGKIIILH